MPGREKIFFDPKKPEASPERKVVLSPEEIQRHHLDLGGLGAWQTDFSNGVREIEKKSIRLEESSRSHGLEEAGPAIEKVLELQSETERELDEVNRLAESFKTRGIFGEANDRKEKIYNLRQRLKQIKIVLGRWDFKGRGSFEVRDQKLAKILGVIAKGTESVNTGISQEESELFLKVKPFYDRLENLRKETNQNRKNQDKRIKKISNWLEKEGVPEGEDIEKLRLELEELQPKFDDNILMIRQIDEILSGKKKDPSGEEEGLVLGRVREILDQAGDKGISVRSSLRRINAMKAEREKAAAAKNEKPQDQESQEKKIEFDIADFRKKARFYLELKPQLDLLKKQSIVSKEAAENLETLLGFLPEDNRAFLDLTVQRLVLAERGKRTVAKETRPEIRKSGGLRISLKAPVRERFLRKKGGASLKDILLHKISTEFNEASNGLHAQVEEAAGVLQSAEYQYRQKFQDKFADLDKDGFAKLVGLKNAELHRAEEELKEFEKDRPVEFRIEPEKEEKQERYIKREKKGKKGKAGGKKKEDKKKKKRITPLDIFNQKREKIQQRVRGFADALKRLESYGKGRFGGPEKPVSAAEQDELEKGKESLVDLIRDRQKKLESVQKELTDFYAGESKNPKVQKTLESMRGLGLDFNALRNYRLSAELKNVVVKRNLVLEKIDERLDDLRYFTEKAREKFISDSDNNDKKIALLNQFLKELEHGRTEAELLPALQEIFDAAELNVDLDKEFGRLQSLDQENYKLEDIELGLRKQLRGLARKSEVSRKIGPVIQESKPIEKGLGAEKEIQTPGFPAKAPLKIKFVGRKSAAG